jgi:MFS superfamily sulfate permease-like transporter
MFEVLEEIIWLAYKVATMSFENAITIILTALGVMLAVLAIGIAVAAIWGYAGFKEFVREAAKTHVAEAMATKMKEYPEGTKVLDAMRQLAQRADVLEQLQNQLVTKPEPKIVETPSDNAVQIDKYPGEVPNASDPRTTADAGPDNSQTSD